MAELQRGWVAPDVAAEHPGVDLYWLALQGGAGRSPRALRDRLAAHADRIAGARAVAARGDSVPWAYRVLWRRLGVDPDEQRPPFEALLAERLEQGGLRARGLPGDALAAATLETGVPLVAWDADRLDGPPGLRRASAGEVLTADRRLRAGAPIYADAAGPIAGLDGTVAPAAAAGPTTERLVLATLAAPAVSLLELEEALWTAAGLLGGQSGGRPSHGPRAT